MQGFEQCLFCDLYRVHLYGYDEYDDNDRHHRYHHHHHNHYYRELLYIIVAQARQEPTYLTPQPCRGRATFCQYTNKTSIIVASAPESTISHSLNHIVGEASSQAYSTSYDAAFPTITSFAIIFSATIADALYEPRRCDLTLPLLPFLLTNAVTTFTTSSGIHCHRSARAYLSRHDFEHLFRHCHRRCRSAYGAILMGILPRYMALGCPMHRTGKGGITKDRMRDL